MGLLDTIFGRSKPVAPNLDDLFGLPSAAVTLQVSAGVSFNGRAGVCYKPPSGQAPEDVQHEIEQLLALDDHPEEAASTTATSTTASSSEPSSSSGVSLGELRQKVDAYGYRWLLLEDAAIDDLVARVHLINTMLAEAGWGPQLLCSVFSLSESAADQSSRQDPQQALSENKIDDEPIYLVYLYKRGTFYPFAPRGKEQRDNEQELRLKSMLANDLKIESDLSRWFPLWDLPVT